MQNSKIVYLILTLIPQGKVLTYGALARLAGMKNPRVVGNILHKNPDAPRVPCHRVITRDGRMGSNYALGGPEMQEKRLKKEGVSLVNRKVNLKKHLWTPSLVLRLYLRLLAVFGDPGPWPWFGNGPAHTPEEIVIGAILTQNTNWKNVEKALDNLKKENACTIKGNYELGIKNYGKLLELVKPSGYYNQKAKRLFEFCKFITEKHKNLKTFLQQKDVREQLLALYGIGPETADTILLYAGNTPIFVIDSYTKKFTQAHKLTKDLSYTKSSFAYTKSSSAYNSLQKFFMENLPKDTKLFQDYHALIVKWGKSGCVTIKL